MPVVLKNGRSDYVFNKNATAHFTGSGSVSAVKTPSKNDFRCVTLSEMLGLLESRSSSGKQLNDAHNRQKKRDHDRTDHDGEKQNHDGLDE